MKNNHTFLLRLLSFAQGGSWFTYFGVRMLLILYLTGALHYSDKKALGVVALFSGLAELGGVVGGIIADRWLGLKRTVQFGACLLCLGSLTLFFEGFLFLGLSLMIGGVSLFCGNIPALLGNIYEEDSSRKQGFAFFYKIQNLGALAGIVVCSFVANQFGFVQGFGVALIGILSSFFLLLFNNKRLDRVSDKPFSKWGVAVSLVWILFSYGVLLCQEQMVMVLPLITALILLFFGVRLFYDKRWNSVELLKLFVYFGAVIVFFGVEDQMGSSLLLFSERAVDLTLFNIAIPSSLITMMNPVVILLLSTFIAKKDHSLIKPFVLTGAAFGLLALCAFLGFGLQIWLLFAVVFLISVSELMIGPVVYSMASKGGSGLVMGLTSLAFSLSYQLGGKISCLIVHPDQSPSLHEYGVSFSWIVGLLMGAGVLFGLLMWRFNRDETVKIR